MKLKSQLKLRTKILLGFGLVTILMLIIFSVSLVSLLRLGRASDAILKQNYLSIEAVTNMQDAIEQHYRLILDYSTQPNEANLRAIYDAQMLFEHWLTIEKGNFTEKGEAQAVNKLETAYKKYQILTHHSMNLIARGSESIYLYQSSSVRPYLNQVRHYCSEVQNINKMGMMRASNNARNIARRATASLIIIGLLALIMAIVFSLSLSSFIVRPLKKMVIALDKVAAGDYTAFIEYHTNDELGIVSAQFNTMVTKLRQYHEMNIRQIISEKQINEALLQNMDDGLILLDISFKIVNINRTAAKFFLIDAASAFQKHIIELIKSESLFESIQTTAQTGKAPVFEEGHNVILIENSGNRLYLQYYLTPVFLPAGGLLGVMILLQDITHLKQLDKLKSEFLMIASHELKTPLTSINMSISLLKETAIPKLNANENELLSIAFDDTQRLRALISDLLDISKIEAGKIDMNIENIGVSDIINKLLHSFQSLADSKSINLECKVNDALQVRADFAKVTWILSNLISNALRFTPVSGHIMVTAVPSGNFVLFGVEDNGIGIPVEYQNKVFDKFFQVDSPLNVGGTGLGLSICKEIVRAHGGTIWVESEPNQGSKFYFTLPVG